MGGETHPIPSHGSKRRSNPIPWVKIFLQSVPWDGMGWDYPIPCGALARIVSCSTISLQWYLTRSEISGRR